ncbi:hypothetical protein [Paractinoplanes brasiliensis]|nr:hypothetical protein [Actinoplanes brasiliensis]
MPAPFPSGDDFNHAGRPDVQAKELLLASGDYHFPIVAASLS